MTEAAMNQPSRPRYAVESDDDDTCGVCGDACDSEHPCPSCGTSGRRYDAARRAEEDEIWQERYWRSQRDD